MGVLQAMEIIRAICGIQKKRRPSNQTVWGGEKRKGGVCGVVVEWQKVESRKEKGVELSNNE